MENSGLDPSHMNRFTVPPSLREIVWKHLIFIDIGQNLGGCCNIDDAALVLFFFRLSNIVSLNFRGCSITDVSLDHLSRICKNLERLDLTDWYHRIMYIYLIFQQENYFH